MLFLKAFSSIERVHFNNGQEAKSTPVIGKLWKILCKERKAITRDHTLD
jgi:hypothetical protein